MIVRLVCLLFGHRPESAGRLMLEGQLVELTRCSRPGCPKGMAVI